MTASIAGRATTRGFALAAALSLAAIGAALVSQHAFGMEPCPWCVLQRLILLVLAVVAALGAVGRNAVLRRTTSALVALLAVCGVAAALWQHFRAAASASCNLTLADRIVATLRLDKMLPAVFEPRASCADAAVKLLGLPYDFWSLALFTLLAWTGAWLFSRPRGRGLG